MPTPEIQVDDCDYQTTAVHTPRPATSGDILDAVASWWRQLEARVAAANHDDGVEQPCLPSLVAVSVGDDGEGYTAHVTWVV